MKDKCNAKHNNIFHTTNVYHMSLKDGDDINTNISYQNMTYVLCWSMLLLQCPWLSAGEDDLIRSQLVSYCSREYQKIRNNMICCDPLVGNYELP